MSEHAEDAPEEEARVAEARDRAPQSAIDTLLDAAAPASPAPAARPETLVGEVVDTKHPTLRGRVRVRWMDLEGQTFEKWLPQLHGMSVRAHDRVLLTRASNWPEHVVTGVIDGFAARPEVERETKAALELLPDEKVRVHASDGTPLLEVFQGDEGPVVRLLADDVNLELPGSLRVRAQSIEIEATRGQARIKASDDVVVQGEVIHLN
jgi:hypothetical protein